MSCYRYCLSFLFSDIFFGFETTLYLLFQSGLFEISESSVIHIISLSFDKLLKLRSAVIICTLDLRNSYESLSRNQSSCLTLSYSIQFDMNSARHLIDQSYGILKISILIKSSSPSSSAQSLNSRFHLASKLTSESSCLCFRRHSRLSCPSICPAPPMEVASGPFALCSYGCSLD